MSFPLKNILCAIDFSTPSWMALDYSTKLSRHFNSRLLIFHAVCAPSSQIYGTPLAERFRERKGAMEEAAAKIRARMGEPDIEWEPLVIFGDPMEGIFKLARERRPDLVIAGSYGLSGIGRMICGTLVERMARNLSLPLLVIEPTSPKALAYKFPLFSRILVGADIPETGASPKTIDAALFLANAFGAKLRIVHAMTSPMEKRLLNPAEMSYSKQEQMLQERLRERFRERLPQAAREAKILCFAGPSGEVLSDYARIWPADLLVVGIRPRGLIEKLIRGSTTEEVIRNAPCPVLVIPEGLKQQKSKREEKGNE